MLPRPPITDHPSPPTHPGGGPPPPLPTPTHLCPPTPLQGGPRDPAGRQQLQLRRRHLLLWHREWWGPWGPARPCSGAWACCCSRPAAAAAFALPIPPALHALSLPPHPLLLDECSAPAPVASIRRNVAPCPAPSHPQVLWEIVTGERPQRGSLRAPLVPTECPQVVADLIHRCTLADPTARPTAAQLVHELGELARTPRPGGAAAAAAMQCARSTSVVPGAAPDSLAEPSAPAGQQQQQPPTQQQSPWPRLQHAPTAPPPTS